MALKAILDSKRLFEQILLNESQEGGFTVSSKLNMDDIPNYSAVYTFGEPHRFEFQTCVSQTDKDTLSLSIRCFPEDLSDLTWPLVVKWKVSVINERTRKSLDFDTITTTLTMPTSEKPDGQLCNDLLIRLCEINDFSIKNSILLQWNVKLSSKHNTLSPEQESSKSCDQQNIKEHIKATLSLAKKISETFNTAQFRNKIDRLNCTSARLSIGADKANEGIDKILIGVQKETEDATQCIVNWKDDITHVQESVGTNRETSDSKQNTSVLMDKEDATRDKDTDYEKHEKEATMSKRSAEFIGKHPVIKQQKLSPTELIAISNTRFLANKTKTKNRDGTHETQVSEGGEADLHKDLVGCKKNPGHTKFVPVDDFNISHLPKSYHDDDLVEFIKATANLTVRVAVKMTSTERPEFWPNTTVPYAFYNMRGSDVMRVGTGMVRDVDKWTEEYIKRNNMETCPCHKCQHSHTPSKVWGKVSMYTATHVVFDDLEARHTTCRLFFDRQDSPLVTLDGWTVSVAHIEEDWSYLQCATCDVDLLDTLDKMLTHWAYLRHKMHNKYKSSRDEVKLTFIVSHPHGFPKQISVGHWINRYVLDEYDCHTKYTYTTSTCPGSAGSNINILGYNDILPFSFHVHSGVNSEGNSYSSIGRE